jgi:hypothetical protein
MLRGTAYVHQGRYALPPPITVRLLRKGIRTGKRCMNRYPCAAIWRETTTRRFWQASRYRPETIISGRACLITRWDSMTKRRRPMRRL